jgi:hypothetical protein
MTLLEEYPTKHLCSVEAIPTDMRVVQNKLFANTVPSPSLYWQWP